MATSDIAYPLLIGLLPGLPLSHLLAELVATALRHGLLRVHLRVRLLLDGLNFQSDFLVSALSLRSPSLLRLGLLADGSTSVASLGALLLQRLPLLLGSVAVSRVGIVVRTCRLGLNSLLEHLTPLGCLRGACGALVQVEALAAGGLAGWLLRSWALATLVGTVVVVVFGPSLTLLALVGFNELVEGHLNICLHLYGVVCRTSCVC